MTDFFDDFDWQDMAFWGGMAEEFAEEEREQRRWEREQFQDPAHEHDDNSEMLHSRQPDSRPNARRLPRRKPFWQQEERNEMALKEAINFQQRLQIDYVDPDGNHTSQIVSPWRISSKNYYLWVETEEAQTGQPVSVRVDRIENIVFLP